MKTIIPVIFAVFLLVGIGSAYGYESLPEPVKGDDSASVTITEYSDFQCPFCARFFSNTLPTLTKKYIETGKLKMVYSNFPLSFHPEATPAAEASECAHEQGKFWEFHDKVFENQATMSQDSYFTWANEIGLDAKEFEDCVLSRAYQEEVEDDFSTGQKAGVSGTPTFFLENICGEEQKIVGAQPTSVFEAAIDNFLDCGNYPPVLNPVNNQKLLVGDKLVIQLEATDKDEDDLVFDTDASSVLPSTFFFNEITGLFQWETQFSDEGEYLVEFSVTDGKSDDSETIKITVSNLPEICNDDIDNDKNGLIDCDDADSCAGFCIGELQEKVGELEEQNKELKEEVSVLEDIINWLLCILGLGSC